MNNLLLLVVGMSIVTYFPRMIPMVIFKNQKLPLKMKRFLEYIPYAVLASLIFPGILSSVHSVQSAIVGGVISIILSLLRVNLIFIVLGGVVSVFITKLLVG